MPTLAAIDLDQFLEIFLQSRPMMDVRAAIEFGSGAFPSASNRPLLNDEQRHEIGIVYAERGEQAAVERGLELATEDVREQRLQSWIAFINANPGACLYCFRGGLRSRTTQQWLSEAGVEVPLVRGGYKALRRFLLTQLEQLCESSPLWLLGGATAVGKTDVILAHQHSVDLEGRAHHRGSAFGKMVSEQPSQINFENSVIVDWLQRRNESTAPVLFENESRLIGRIHLPPLLQAAMQRASIIELHADRPQRLQRLMRDYIEWPLDNFHGDAEQRWSSLQQYLSSSLFRIRRRLGGALHQQLDKSMLEAVTALKVSSDHEPMYAVMNVLMDEYYDRMYAYQFEKHKERVAFSGDYDAVMDYLSRVR